VAKIEWTISRSFLIAAGALSLQVLVGLFAKAYGHLRALGIRSIVRNALHYPEWEFKKNVLYWALDDIEANRRLVNLKGWVCWFMTFLFITEAVSLTWWLLGSTI